MGENIIKEYRMKSGKKAADIANYLQMSKQQYHACEKEDRMTDENLFKIAYYMKINYNRIYKKLRRNHIKGATIKYYRLKKGMKQYELAQNLNVKESYVALMESRESQYSKYTTEIKELLDIPDEIDMPEIVAWTENYIILDFEERIIILSRKGTDPFIFSSYYTSICKKVIICHTDCDIPRKPTLPDYVISPFPVIIQDEPGCMILETETALLITTNANIDYSVLRSITGKHLIYADSYEEYYMYPSVQTFQEEYIDIPILTGKVGTTVKKFFFSRCPELLSEQEGQEENVKTYVYQLYDPVEKMTLKTTCPAEKLEYIYLIKNSKK